MKRIPVAGPWIGPKEIAYVSDAVTRAWYQDANLYHERFEKSFASYAGRKHAVSLPSCTSAIHLALAGLGIGPGDEVLVPEITWIATSAPVSYVGATPVFVDIDERSWCVDARSVEAAVGLRTRAVIAVDLYGNMPDMAALLAVAAARGLAVIEDAAQAAGSRYEGRPAGSFGLASAFSFHGTKTLTTGEGGMLLTDDDALLERVMRLRDHGRKPGDRMFRNEEVGFKYKMSAMQAALGLAQLERLDELVARKREIFGWYREALAGARGITLNHEAPGVLNTYWMVTVLLDPSLGRTKEDVIPRLFEAGIDVRPFFYPLSDLPAYRELPGVQAARARNAVAYRLAPRGINLPSGFHMTRDLAGRVCGVLREILGV